MAILHVEIFYSHFLESRVELNNAIRSLPISQHKVFFQGLIKLTNAKSTSLINMYVREKLLKLDAQLLDEYIDFLAKNEMFLEAFNCYSIYFADLTASSSLSKSHHRSCIKFCNLIKNSNQILKQKASAIEDILKSLSSLYPEHTAYFWCSLAEFHINYGNLELAKRAFLRGIHSKTVFIENCFRNSNG